METTSKTVNVVVEVTEGINVQEQSKVGDNVFEDPLKCCYPDCIFANMLTSPQLDVCQGMCGQNGRFHRACNVNWLETQGINAELHKICYACVCAQYPAI